MKRILFLTLLVVGMTQVQAAGIVVNDTILGVPCRVYVPTSAQPVRYPVLYLHHGMYGNETDWTEKGRLVPILDSLLALGEISEMVVVMPDNCPSKPTSEEEKAAATNGEWERQFAAFMSEAESRYPILSDPAHRAIAGLSMGGYHTMRVSHVLDGRFAYVGMFSPATFVHEYSPSAKLRWLAIGTDDFLYEDVKAYRLWLDDHAVTYHYYQSAGGHEWTNWQEYLVLFLKACK